MKMAFFDTHPFEREVFQSLKPPFQIEYIDSKLTERTANLVHDSEVVCAFVNDKLDRACLQQLKKQGVKMIALRSAGFNHVDLVAARELGLVVSRVPGYSPHAVAEFAVALLLSLNRHLHRSYTRVRDMNFSLDGLVGFDLHGKTVAVIGTGKIGRVFAEIMLGFGCRVLAVDRQKDPELQQRIGFKYVELDEALKVADVISLHVPLTNETRHLIDDKRLALMKPEVLLINTSRGAVIDTKALIRALKSKRIAGAGLDVYEEEEVFFKNHSEDIVQDDVLARLVTFPNVLLTSHQAFLTREALQNIAKTTIDNVENYKANRPTNTV